MRRVREFQVPDRFFQNVRLHLFANFADLPRPSLMGIFGRPGEGKSVQLEMSIERCGTEVLWVNAGDLESDNAGEPARLLVAVLKEAAEATRDGAPTAVVLHDIDTTLGEWKNNSGTVNHQHLLAELMHFADRPRSPRFGGRRIPLFVTGNDGTKVYQPLTRARRMTLFSWTPTLEEKAEIINAMFGCERADVFGHVLVSEFPGQPVAFFADVLSSLDEIAFLQSSRGFPDDMRQVIAMSQTAEGRTNVEAPAHQLDAVRCAAIDMQRERASSISNFLEEGDREPKGSSQDVHAI